MLFLFFVLQIYYKLTKMVKNKDVERISLYLKGDDVLLYRAIVEEINHQRRIECDCYYQKTGFNKQYKAIGNSELIVQLLKRFKETSKQNIIQKLEYYNRQAEYYEERLRNINILKKDELLKNEIRTQAAENI